MAASAKNWEYQMISQVAFAAPCANWPICVVSCSPKMVASSPNLPIFLSPKLLTGAEALGSGGSPPTASAKLNLCRNFKDREKGREKKKTWIFRTLRMTKKSTLAFCAFALLKASSNLGSTPKLVVRATGEVVEFPAAGPGPLL